MVENPSIPILLMCGSTSTICGQLVSYPLALIRTRLQAQEVPMDSSKRDTMTKLFVTIWKNEGVRGLYRGLVPNIIKVVPAVSISYAVVCFKSLSLFFCSLIILKHSFSLI